MTELFGDIPGVNIDWDTHVIVNDLNYIKALAGIIANATREELGKFHQSFHNFNVIPWMIT